MKTEKKEKKNIFVLRIYVGIHCSFLIKIKF